MSEARWGKRYEQRLEATYGIGSHYEKGFVLDIAPFGLFLSGNLFYHPDTRLKIKIVLDNENLVEFEGKVCWWKTQERLAWFDLEAGMGIKISHFIEGEIYYQDYVKQLCFTQKNRKLPFRG